MPPAILFVEDNQDLRDNATLVLQLEGYLVEVAGDGLEALETLERGFVPDLIVSDIMMPRMDGYEFFQAVRRNAHLRAVPFIFLTARGSRDDISTGRIMGADDYLIKPFDPEEFLIAIENKLRRTEEIRTQASKSLDTARQVLVQLLSHELRTPLTYVTGGFALLAEELEAQQNTEAEDVRVSLGLIQSGTQRLNRLAEQMVTYSEIVSGQVETLVEERSDCVELDFLTSDALTLLSNMIKERDTQVMRIAPEDDVLVCGVRELLISAIYEVIRNAVQYSPPGNSIDLIVSNDEDYGILQVIDRGPGIPQEDQDRVWELLIQSGRERTEQQGIGMGLPIVKGIITAHGGDIKLESVRNEGTTVTLYFRRNHLFGQDEHPAN